MLNINKLIKKSGINIDDDLFYGMEFNDFNELMDYLNDDDRNYISDKISEIADSNISIYSYDLRLWAVDNYGYIEQAIDEGLVDTSKFDFHRAIQAGQYLQNREDLYNQIDEFKNYIESNYKF